MSLQYITNDKGQTTGVFIPIQEWNNLKSKYEGIEEDVHVVPEWQKEIVRERIKNTKPEEYQSWDEVRQQLKFD
ncbi:MAG: addiction module component CHP02574 family protein [Cyclonatronaceae bacterium]